MKQRKIIYVTGTRADYGLMREVLKKLDKSLEIDFSICVTGMHLSPLYGNTINEIEKDKFRISGIIPVDVDKTTQASMTLSIGQQIVGMTELFQRERPDLILLLGDRGEMLAAAIVAVHLNIFIAHLHGGERSGTVDEMVRHAISKLSHYHFVATQGSKERLVKMGEREDMIFMTGAPGLDEIYQYQPLYPEVFYKRYELSLEKKTALLIYHPVVQEFYEIKTQFLNVINAALTAGLQVLCLEPNSDAGGQSIRDALKEYTSHKDVTIIKHLVRTEYIDCLANCDLMLGNSSSAIIEAASFNLVAVNIGSRQNLRECGDNVIHVATSYEAILKGIEEALQLSHHTYKNIYGNGDASEKCYQLLKSVSLNSELLNKSNAY